MTDADCLDFLAQELGFVVKSEQSKALELLLREKVLQGAFNVLWCILVRVIIPMNKSLLASNRNQGKITNQRKTYCMFLGIDKNRGGPHNVCLSADCYLLVNVLDLPFASPITIYREACI